VAETWRVVLASGEVMGVEVVHEEHRWSARTLRDRAATRHRSAEMAVRRLVATHLAADFDVREILAPGELTRAEIRAQAWREGAEAMRAECVSCCDAVARERSDAARHVEGTNPSEARRRTGEMAGASMCVQDIRALPVPPCPEVSR